MKTSLIRNLVLGAGLCLGTAFGASADDVSIVKKTGHEIRMYSRYTIWDNITYRVQDGNVELNGQVSQPFKKEDLQRIVQRIPGVTSVTNDLHVLPLSPMDDHLRLQVARAIFHDPVLSQIAMEPIPSIHIIVDNGHVTLEGVVSTEMEKNVAGLRANAAGLSFGAVTNNLHVDNPAKKVS